MCINPLFARHGTASRCSPRCASRRARRFLSAQCGVNAACAHPLIACGLAQPSRRSMLSLLPSRPRTLLASLRGERCSEHCSESSGDCCKSKPRERGTREAIGIGLFLFLFERQLRQRRARPAGAARPAHTLHTVAALSTAVWASLVYSSYGVGRKSLLK